MSGVPGHPQIPGVFEASLGCVRPCPSLTDKVTPLSGAGCLRLLLVSREWKRRTGRKWSS